MTNDALYREAMKGFLLDSLEIIAIGIVVNIIIYSIIYIIIKSEKKHA